MDRSSIYNLANGMNVLGAVSRKYRKLVLFQVGYAFRKPRFNLGTGIAFGHAHQF